LEVQGHNPVTSDDYITKTINLSKALKDQFPNVVIFGPVHYGFQGLYNWQGELSATPGGTNWFPDKYLQALKTASTAYGKPLVDVYDFHWYAEVYDASGTRILNLNGTTLTDAQVQLIVQSPGTSLIPRSRTTATATRGSLTNLAKLHQHPGSPPSQDQRRILRHEGGHHGVRERRLESHCRNHRPGR